MSIKRAPRPKSHYTIISNDVLRDSRLSFKARGLLACILSRPDNWRTTSDALSRESKEGRSAILSGLKELQEIGYMTQTKYKNEKGHWVWESIVYDQPQGLKPNIDYPTTDNPITENPITNKPITDNLTILEEHIKKKDKEEQIRTTDIEPHDYAVEIHVACEMLAHLIVENGSKRPTVTDKWLADMERMHRIDERSWEQITKAIQWCQADDFWRGNIMSPAKLRKQYDQLRLAAERTNKQSKFTKTLDWIKNLENDTKEIER